MEKCWLLLEKVLVVVWVRKKKYLESKKKKILSKIDLMNGIERCIF